jgi:hypothetical protein
MKHLRKIKPLSNTNLRLLKPVSGLVKLAAQQKKKEEI